MSPSIAAGPTSRQLHYLRSLADRTATTFAYPQTRVAASREIDRLRGLSGSGRAQPSERGEAVPDHLLYATAVHASEVVGYGSSATWRTASGPTVRPEHPKDARRSSTELARYRLSGEERVLYGERTRRGVRILDGPVGSSGCTYVVEREFLQDGPSALRALVSDYVAQAQTLDEVPMAAGAVRQMLAQAGPDA